MTEQAIRNWTPRTLAQAVGEQIAEGRGRIVRRPRLSADDWSGIVEWRGETYRARCRWPDDAEAHEVKVVARKI
jgi:hypothetical protein